MIDLIFMMMKWIIAFIIACLSLVLAAYALYGVLALLFYVAVFLVGMITTSAILFVALIRDTLRVIWNELSGISKEAYETTKECIKKIPFLKSK